jgi:D-glycero-D-manno-heptose 1,7-bisphosphate phosphatase
MRAAIFLDRDGVIIENCAEYVRTWEDVVFLPRALEALARLSATPYLVFFVTNQSVVGRGIIPMEQALMIQERIVAQVRLAGGRVDGSFLCPHAPQEKCECRKPRPGLLLQAAEKFDLDLSRSFMVGDALSDLQAGWNAGAGRSILVMTGRGKEQIKLPEAQLLQVSDIYPDLYTFVDHLFSGGCLE